jgi:peptidoglycan/LPS O-acetylase OafA/YrhL
VQETHPSTNAFRLDIQGLRAVAVVLVLVYHLWPNRVTGGFVGVDVFFVISGFLITAHLLQHPPRGPRDLVEFWGRRIRRLLPAAFLVLLATAIASRVLAPETRWGQTASEVIASALYVENWVLAATSVDYLAAAEPPTPVQHYWSLAVEEQFYLAWPILILATFWLATRARSGGIAATRVAMLGVVGFSLFYSITATAEEPASAYFITPTRVWELAAGGLIATVPPLAAMRLSPRAIDAVAWIGFAMLVLAGFVLTAETPFPGTAALLPVLGTCLVIVAAAQGGRSPTRLLRIRPIQHLGDTSYSIYLWHWPLIVLWPYISGRVGILDSLAILGLTIVLATATKILVEDPYRFSPKFQALKPTFRFAAVGMLVLSILGSAQLFESQLRLEAALATIPELPGDPVVDSTSEPTQEASAEPGSTDGPPPTLEPGSTAAPPGPTPAPAIASCVGAAAIVRGFAACPQDPAGKMVPQPVAARVDKADAYRDGCWNYAPFGTRTTCRYGNGEVRVALVGNSHAGQWLPALQVLAKKHGWTITTYLASQCNLTDARLEFFSNTKSTGCLTYGDWVLGETRGQAYDLVIASERQSVKTEGNTWPETMAPAVAGYTSYLQGWSDAGTNLLVVQDTPFPGKVLGTVPDCLAQHSTNQPACAGTPQSWSWLDPLYAAATGLQLPGVTTMETHRFLCTATECPAVIGTVIAYFDGSHMTATYVRTLAPFIEPEVLAALGRATAT